MRRCSNCDFFVHTEGAKYGRCHRYPPQRVTFTTLYGVTAGSSTRMPRMPSAAWCGEFKLRENEHGR